MNTGYILSAWIIVFGGLAAYAGVTLARGRRLARRVPPERRRWVDTDATGAESTGDSRLDRRGESPTGRARPSGGERTTRPSGGERKTRPSGGERKTRPSGGERKT